MKVFDKDDNDVLQRYSLYSIDYDCYYISPESYNKNIDAVIKYLKNHKKVKKYDIRYIQDEDKDEYE